MWDLCLLDKAFSSTRYHIRSVARKVMENPLPLRSIRQCKFLYLAISEEVRHCFAGNEKRCLRPELVAKNGKDFLESIIWPVTDLSTIPVPFFLGRQTIQDRPK